MVSSAPAETAEADRVPAGQSPERVGMFFDAVLAIAITLLVLEIKRPEGEEARHLLRFMADNWSGFLDYFIAFSMLWVVWRSHHKLLDRVERLRGTAMFLHMPLLLFAAFLPYPTGLLGTDDTQPVAITFFAGTWAVIVFLEALVAVSVRRMGLLRDEHNSREVAAEEPTLFLVSGYFALTAVAAWWVPDIEWAWLATPILVRAGDRLGRVWARRR
jgi:uncharacterized membrane protein